MRTQLRETYEKIFNYNSISIFFGLAPILENEDIESFLQEGLLMKEFDDCNVLKLKGICFDEDNSPLVLLPFMNRGDLLSYIRDPKNILIIEDLLLFAVGIAKGIHNIDRENYFYI